LTAVPSHTRLALLWLPILVWAGIIFALSATPNLRVAQAADVDFLVRKAGHMFVFGVLAVLIWPALAIDRAPVENRARCAVAVAASPTSLTSIFGISDLLAAKILGHVGDVGCLSSAECFASYSGTAPIEVSSGEVTRHRLSTETW